MFFRFFLNLFSVSRTEFRYFKQQCPGFVSNLSLLRKCVWLVSLIFLLMFATNTKIKRIKHYIFIAIENVPLGISGCEDYCVCF